MTCLHCQPIHWPGRHGQLKRLWCRLHWRLTHCDGCASRINDEGGRFESRAGVCRLAAAIIAGAILSGDYSREDADRLGPLDAALTWATTCGLDPHIVAPVLLERARCKRRD